MYSDNNDELMCARNLYRHGKAQCFPIATASVQKKKTNLVRLFKTAINMMPFDTEKIVVHTDKMLAGEHVQRFNAPTIDKARNDQLTKIAETHDATISEYPSFFGMMPMDITLT
ncbi:unnamed protein product [Onchocerca ochengi]|uniref:Transposase n=1 Tax=Onchocerca ochengi TaxID=42157 RepID=A0A182EVB2_ONCOC|nr:unnamed protein product [Onchocerca ochengi]